MAANRPPRVVTGSNPYWYKDAIIYELHVRAFLDSNADGVGDFRGLAKKLDYLQELGVTALWLLPFYPSPLKDDGYDIADYYSVNPIYGTLKDFKFFLQEAHIRNLRVITELVVNHTSDQHPWFQRSRQAPQASNWRNFYVWSSSPDKYREARIIFRDFEPSNWTWDPVAKAYYWHRFYSHQPDLNFDNPQVHKEITRVLDFWLGMGVDGVRLDAVPYLYEREGTSCENLPETHQYLKTLRSHVDKKYGDRMLLAEANQWPEEAVTYFGSGKGDECHMAFHFPLMPRIFMSVRMEDRVPIVDILQQTPPIPETSQWALFLRNHDELTLEMVTDEERDYMYRVYANDAKARLNLGIRRRLAPLMGNDRKRIELLYMLLLSLPGTPVLYYGDEIGMGDNIFLGDRNGVRTPMQWSSDKNAGFSRASPQALYFPIILDPEYHYEAVNVEAQQANPNSLFWWLKRTLTLRKRYQAFGRGTLRFLHPENRKVLAFIRQYGNETLLVIANLSRFPQPERLDLSEFKDRVPLELFGHGHFPVITAQPYSLTLSPYWVFWFSLEPATKSQVTEELQGKYETIQADGEWENLLEANDRGPLENCLMRFLNTRTWFAGKSRDLKSVQIREVIKLTTDSERACILFLLAEYREGDPEEYLLPISAAFGSSAEQLEKETPQQIIARLRFESGADGAFLHSCTRNKSFCLALIDAIARRRVASGTNGEFKAIPAPAFRVAEARQETPALEPVFGKGERSNTDVFYSDKYFLKLFRRLEVGTNPDLELQRFLTERGFPNIAPIAGWLEYRRNNGESFTLGVLSRFVPAAQDFWSYSLDMLGRYFERIRTVPPESRVAPPPGQSLLELAAQEPSETVIGLLGTYSELARLLGQRTGELHLALASEHQNPEFAPEPFTPFYQRGLFQSMRNLAVRSLYGLQRRLDKVPANVRPQAEKVAGLEFQILKRLRAVYQTPLAAKRIRCHGDLHLGEVLYTGKDFIFIDFEGEPSRSLGERRIKRSPFRDVAAVVRSFDYITRAALFHQLERGTLQPEQLQQLESWSSFWYRWVSALYLKAYLKVMANSDLLPQNRAELGILFEAHLLEKALYEINYELQFRPDWLLIPLRGILQLVEASSAT